MTNLIYLESTLSPTQATLLHQLNLYTVLDGITLPPDDRPVLDNVDLQLKAALAKRVNEDRQIRAVLEAMAEAVHREICDRGDGEDEVWEWRDDGDGGYSRHYI